jgi:hypothetical protein
VRHVGLTDDESFHDNILNLIHDTICVSSLLIEYLKNGIETPLMAAFLLAAVVIAGFLLAVLLLAPLILLEGLVMFINGVIREVHEHVVHV